jgi:hypothetical protein
MEEHRIGSTRSWIKMRYHQVIGVDFIDLLGQELSTCIVGRDAYLDGVRSGIPE